MDQSIVLEPPTLDDIIDNFSLLEDWDDRYRYVIELGRGLTPMSELDRTDANKVQGCPARSGSRRHSALMVTRSGSASPATATRISCAAWSRSCWRWCRARTPPIFWQRTRSRCSSASACANISRRSARTGSGRWSSDSRGCGKGAGEPGLNWGGITSLRSVIRRDIPVEHDPSGQPEASGFRSMLDDEF